MTEEKKEIKFYPEPVAGILIYNDKGEMLLTKNPKWGDLWNLPGGHIELGEAMEDAAKREAEEETGLKVDNIKFLGCQNVIYPKEFYEKKHFIALDFAAKLVGGEIKKSDKNTEYIWIMPAKALEKLKINPFTADTIKRFLQKNENFEDKYKRALADYQNLLKQAAKEKAEFAKYANEMIILNILPVYDNLKIALIHANGEKMAEGIKHVANQFKEILKNFGVEEIIAENKEFDHNQMEAVEEKETDDKKSDRKVAEEISAGYKLNGKIIKAARVAVYKYKK
jgi:nucleoside triphosphatase